MRLDFGLSRIQDMVTALSLMDETDPDVAIIAEAIIQCVQSEDGEPDERMAAALFRIFKKVAIQSGYSDRMNLLSRNPQCVGLVVVQGGRA